MEFSFGELQFSLTPWAIIAVAFALFIVPRLLSRKARKKKDSLGRAEVQYTLGSEHTFKPSPNKKTIAIVDVRGPILTSASGFSGMASRVGCFGVETGQLIRELGENDSVQGILVRFSTPGGTVIGSEEICDGIVSATARKPVVAYVQDLSASGGVMGMVGANHIVAHPSSMIGSIGVLGPMLKRYRDITSLGSGLFGEQVTGKVTGKVLYAGEGKAFGHPFAEDDQDTEDYFQALLNKTYEKFKAHVSGHRPVPPHALHEIGARILLAEEAKQLKLIDSVGNEGRALNVLSSLIKNPFSTDDLNLVHVRLKMGGQSLPFFSLSGEVKAQNDSALYTELARSLRTEPFLLCSSYHLNRLLS